MKRDTLEISVAPAEATSFTPEAEIPDRAVGQYAVFLPGINALSSPVRGLKEAMKIAQAAKGPAYVLLVVEAFTGKEA